jgi:hypothetical protein
MSQARKALINSPDTVVCEAIEGLVSATPHLARLDGFPAVSTPCCASAPQLVGTVHSKSSTSSEVDGHLKVRPLVAAPAGAVAAQPASRPSIQCFVCYALLSADQSCCGHNS